MRVSFLERGRLMFFAAVLMAVNGAWADIDMRRVVDLSGSGWTLTEADGSSSVVCVPHSWNVEDGCDGKGVLSSEQKRKNSSCASSYERKRVVYSRELPDPKTGRRYFVRCDGASITSVVKVNGTQVGKHLGAFTAFCFEVTDALKPSGNRLEIVVDNFSRDDVAPPVNADFTMYGGLHRKVWLIETPRICIDPTRDGGSGVRLFPNPETGEVRAEIAVSGGADETRTFSVGNFRLWSPETPVVYTQRFEIASGDAVVETFGFRKIEFREDGFYLNGVRRKLRGVNYHQDREGRGWAVSDDERAADIALVKELSADAIRTAHYPHADRTYSLCDEKGLLVWCEQPNVNGLRFNETFRANSWRQTREMVVQLGNHPSIFCWSIFNELYNKVPMTEGEPESMMEDLRDYVKTLDPSRPVAAASDMVKKNRLNAIPEVLGFNRYPGWYGADGVTMRDMVDEVCRETGRTSLGMSEYGAGGSPRQHGDARMRNIPYGNLHTEEYQAYVHACDYRDLVTDPRIWGSFVWCMFDFGSDCRLEGEHWGINDKGLMTFDHRERKDAWYLYHANWSAEPTLRLVGSRQSMMTNETATVLGFSNLGDVTLEVNGRTVGTKTPDEAKTVLWESVPLAIGRNVVSLSAGGQKSTAIWTRLPALNYDRAKIGEVKLENPLAFTDGRPVASAADWSVRRQEILGLFQREMYGQMPEAINPVVDVIDEGVTLGGYGIRKLVRMYFRPDRTGPCVNWLMLLPRFVQNPAPSLLFLNYGGNHELFDDPVVPVPTCWMRPSPEFKRYGTNATEQTRGLYSNQNMRTTYPVGMILARGFAVVTACYQEISPDFHGRILDGRYGESDVLSLFPYNPARTDNPTALGAWAWALCRAMDMIQGESRLDAKRVTVLGSSRLAKAALIAGAFDERFYAVVPNQTGGGGCPLLKRNFGENVTALMRNFPHWFCSDFGKYADRENEMPVDSHLLMACVAPRKLLIEGFDDPFYDTEGEFEALKAASPVWTFLGRSGLPRTSWPAAYDVSAIGPDIGYVHRSERHGLSAHDWTWIMDFVEGMK